MKDMSTESDDVLGVRGLGPYEDVRLLTGGGTEHCFRTTATSDGVRYTGYTNLLKYLQVLLADRKDAAVAKNPAVNYTCPYSRFLKRTGITAIGPFSVMIQCYYTQRTFITDRCPDLELVPVLFFFPFHRTIRSAQCLY
jgi:hypothetical protein